MKFKIGGIQRSSLLDYPEKISAIVFTQGCNFRCGYCHNPGLLCTHKKPAYQVSVLCEFLKTRVGKLDGIVITGGEPCLQEDLEKFIVILKEIGFLIKLDTNGSYPDKLESLLNKNLLDYVAMDIKAPLHKYTNVANVKISPKDIEKSVNFIKNSNVNYEFRTTVLKSQLNFDDFEKIGNLINGSEKYYIQKFAPTKILESNLNSQLNYSNKEFEQIKNQLKKYVKYIEIR